MAPLLAVLKQLNEQVSALDAALEHLCRKDEQLSRLCKDAYDLYYVIRSYGSGPTDIAAKLQPLLDGSDAQRALTILKRDFSDPDAVGPVMICTRS